MKVLRAIFFTAIFGVSYACVAQTATPVAVPLMLSLAPTAKVTEFRVELHNKSAEALNLILGMALGNGRRQYIDAVTYSLQMPDGSQLHLESKGPGYISGRVDPLIVPLPPGASFSYLVDLADCCWAPKQKIFELALAEGRYTLAAEYNAKPISASVVNLDVPGIALIPFWTGTVASSTVAFTVPAPTRK